MNKSKDNKKFVDFASLDDQNKTQFLEFLIKNNIEFQPSTENDMDNYVAKVTVKKNDAYSSKKNTTPKNQNMLKTKKDITQKINIKNSNKQNKAKTPKNRDKSSKSEISPLKQKNKVSNVLKPNDVIKTDCEIKKSKQIQRNHKKREIYKENIDYVPKYHQGHHSLYKGTKSVNKSPKINNRTISKNKNMQKQDTKGHKQYKKIDLKKKTNLQKESSELFTKYLKKFNLKLAGHRATKWSISTIGRQIQQIYGYLFNKSSIPNLKIKNGQCFLIKYIKEYFLGKYKNDRIGTNNLINMLNTLANLQIEQRNVCLKNLGNNKQGIMRLSIKIFRQFILQIYEEQDLLFFLFVRNIIRKYQKNKNLNTIADNGDTMHNFQELSQSTILGNTIQSLQIDNIAINFQKTGIQILSFIFGGQQELVHFYFKMITQMQNISSKIYPIQLLVILLDTYRNKRLNRNQKNHIEQQLQTNNQKQIMILNASGKQTQFNDTKFQNIPSLKDIHMNVDSQQDSIFADDLTFGDQTKQQLKLNDQTQTNQLQASSGMGFWKIVNKSIYKHVNQEYPINNHSQISHMDSHYQNLSEMSIEGLLVNKMNRKVDQLVNIMVQSHSSYNSKKASDTIRSQTCKFNLSLHSNNPLFINSKELNQSQQLKWESGEQRNEFVHGFYQKQSLGKFDIFENKFSLKQIILKKCLALLGCIMNMDKLKWFDELYLTGRQTENDMFFVQKLQLMYRKLCKNPELKAIGELCKTIITVQHLTIALQKLFMQY